MRIYQILHLGKEWHINRRSPDHSKMAGNIAQLHRPTWCGEAGGTPIIE